MPIERTRKLAMAALLPLLLGACEHGMYEMNGEASSFGEANRQTMLAQTVDPDPVYEEPLESSGDHAAQAVDRYSTDKVKKPDTIRATSGAKGSGGS